ncbi:MAG: 3-keto-disaccharide hydrolase [Akkermansiaceae bacterium]
MTKHKLLGMGLMFSLAAGSVSAQKTMEEPVKEAYEAKVEAAREGEWVDLFNGKDLKGWQNVYGFGDAKVVDGVIELTGDKKFFLTTEKTFANFELEVEIMLPAVGPANSGVMYRCHVDKDAGKHKIWGYQAECDPTKRAYTGRLYDEGRRRWDLLTEEQKKITKSVQAPLGEWIKYRIVANGDHLQVWVNGEVTTDLHDDKDAAGHIGIQHHGEKGKTYSFRNIRIKELK